MRESNIYYFSEASFLSQQQEGIAPYYEPVRGAITAGEIEEQFRSYWFNPCLYRDEAAFLAQTPIYSFGNEIFGCIFDVFGIEIMFECLYHPAKTMEYFNRTACGYVIPQA